MRLGAAAFLALSSTSALVQACADHNTPREWSQEDLDLLEQKWGVDVSLSHSSPPEYLCKL